ncbi:MAG: glycosyltransferase family 4 protein [Blastocatellia bacterium]
MKVLQFLDTVGRGGAEIQVLDLCRNAADFEIDVTFAMAGGGALESDFRSLNIEVSRFQRKLPVDLYLASQLRRLIKERGIEIVHGYQPVDGLHLYLSTRGLKNVKKVLSFQGFITDRKNRAVSKFLIPRMDANIAVSRGLQKWLAEEDKLATKNFTVVYNGADPGRLKPEGKSLKHELNLPDDTILFGMIANFYRDPRKDQLTICKALPKVFSEIRNSHFIFAGGIEQGAEDKMAECLNVCIENGITERVHFLGARGDVPDVLRSLDVFVFSSFHEGLPVAVSEAMLAGVPMILSDIEPLIEASDDGNFAEIFPVGDAEKLAAKMVELGTNAERRTELSTKAKTFADENFSIGAHLHELKKLYRSLLTN